MLLMSTYHCDRYPAESESELSSQTLEHSIGTVKGRSLVTNNHSGVHYRGVLSILFHWIDEGLLRTESVGMHVAFSGVVSIITQTQVTRHVNGPGNGINPKGLELRRTHPQDYEYTQR
jgi:hypothetical protein